MEISIEELMAQNMYEEQQRSLPSILEENLEKEEMEYYEDITIKRGGELEKLQRGDDDAHELKELVAREDESTSP